MCQLLALTGTTLELYHGGSCQESGPLRPQLLAQELRPEGFVAVAGYGDCGPGYIPLARSYAEGGYEPVDAFVSGECEALMREAGRQPSRDRAAVDEAAAVLILQRFLESLTA